MLQHFTVGYQASAEFELAGGDANADADDDHQLYHLEPFGSRALQGSETKQLPHFLPQYTEEGELYIGVHNLAPPRNLSLLFQIAEGSADPDLEPQPVQWSFLNGNHWTDLDQEGRILTDTTNGLLNSGIIEFDLPAVAGSNLLPPDLHWLRATISRNSRSVGDMVAIQAQAVSATFQDRGNALDHLAQPLPSESITGLAEPEPEVKAIHQPYSSFGGKSAEEPTHFYTRVSERLRHKNRALTSWDYERLILEAFPDIHKVKCLPVGVSADPKLAGRIQVIVIPDIKGKLPFDPFEPKVPADMLVKIERFLRRHTSPSATFLVKNPRYVQLKVRFAVRFNRGSNPGYYRQVLQQELQRFLAPWAYDQSADIVLGGRINANLIVDFVDRRPYVDFLASIRLFTSQDGQRFEPVPAQHGKQAVEAPVAPDAILVSARAHEFDLITEDRFEEESFVGINHMQIELDFVVD